MLDTYHALLREQPPVASGTNGDNEGRLYHYTSYAGLLGIIQSKSLWASKLRFLNDADEFIHGLDIAETLARERAKDSDGEEKELLQKIASRRDSYHRANVFVSSFTEQPDVLSQWRGYAGAGGASLGFSVVDLRRAAEANSFKLIKCVYDQPTKIKIANEFLDLWLSRIPHARESFGDDYLDSASWGFTYDYFQAAAAFKHSAFHEEAEWRLVSTLISSHDEKIGFRPLSTMIVPYFKIDLDVGVEDGGKTNIGLREILLGPNNNPEDMKDALGMVLARYKIRYSSYTNSKAPYRSL